MLIVKSVHHFVTLSHL